MSNGNSRFTFTLSPTTKYSILLDGLQPPYYVHDVSFRDDSILRQAFAPEAPGVLRITLRDDGASLLSLVTRRNGTPAVGATVIMFMSSNRAGDVSTSLKAAFTNEGGRAEFDALSPGEYYVVALPSSPPSIVLRLRQILRRWISSHFES